MLDWDALVPSTATLSVFVMFVLLIAAAGSVVAPLTTADQQTITEGDSIHPINSEIPAAYAETFQQQGIAASPERLLFEVTGDEPFLVRGVDYAAYASLSEPTIVAGRPPETSDEAIVGADLRRTLGVGVGDSVTLGGSTAAAFTRVEVVGVFTASGMQDDQLLVSLDTAGHLAGRRADTVNFIRTERIPDADPAVRTLAVVETDVRANETATRVRINVQNYGLSRVTETVPVELGSETRRVAVDLRPGGRTWVTARFGPRPDGEYELRTAGVARAIRIGPGSDQALGITVPDRIPADASPAVVVTRDGEPVSGVTVTVVGRNATWTTGDNGAVRVPFPTAGTETVRATAGNVTATATVDVGGGVDRAFTSSVGVSPANPSVATRPVAVATLNNPWAQPVTQTVTLVQADTVTERSLTLQPGTSERLRLRLPNRPAGAYTVTVLQDGRNTTAATYQVQGDERLAAALASSGRRSSGGSVTQAVSVVFGNVRILVAAMVLLVGLMTVGATTASFARSIHAAREEIGVRRAVGASPFGIYRLVVGDALRIGATSALLAVGIGSGVVWGLLTLGELRLFGIALRPTFSPALLAATAAAALALALVSVAVATVSLVRVAPARLLVPMARRAPARTGVTTTTADDTGVNADD